MLTVVKVSNKNTRTLCHAVFIFIFEHIRQINLIFLLVILNIYLPVGHKMKYIKQRKYTLNNRAVSSKLLATCDMSKSTWFK